MLQQRVCRGALCSGEEALYVSRAVSWEGAPKAVGLPGHLQDWAKDGILGITTGFCFLFCSLF